MEAWYEQSSWLWDIPFFFGKFFHQISDSFSTYNIIFKNWGKVGMPSDVQEYWGGIERNQTDFDS